MVNDGELLDIGAPFAGIVRFVSVGAPIALERSGRGVEDDDAPIDVAVSDKNFIRPRIDVNVRRIAQILRVVASFAFSAVPDLQQKFPAFGELENLVLRLVGPTAGAQPDIVLVVDKNTVLVLIERPIESLLRRAP